MRCDRYRHDAPDDARFCSGCGSPSAAKVETTPRIVARNRRGRRELWRGLAATTIALLLVGLTFPLMLAACGGEEATVTSSTTSTTRPVTTTARPRPATTAKPVATTTSSTTSTTLSTPLDKPGDSPGEWVAMRGPVLDSQPLSVSLSDDWLLVQTETESGFALVAHELSSGTTYELPVGDRDVGGIDVDGRTAVWWEGSYDPGTSSYVDQHIYSYRLPDGLKQEIAGGDKNLGYPQVAGRWITWVEGRPWEENPDEYWEMPVFASLLDSQGRPVDEPTCVVPSAVTYILGDAGWTYSLSRTFLAWEQGAEKDGLTPGTHVLDLGTLEVQALGPDSWRPSLAEHQVVFWNEGLVRLDLLTGERSRLDPLGDFATAGSTFAAYYRPTGPSGSGTGYEIVARGNEGAHEQVLTQQADAPWLSAAIATSQRHVACLAAGTLYLFEWKAE